VRNFNALYNFCIVMRLSIKVKVFAGQRIRTFLFVAYLFYFIQKDRTGILHPYGCPPLVTFELPDGFSESCF
jgi:hypothetical protein